MGDPAFACCRVSEFRLLALGGVSNQFFFSPTPPPPAFFLLSPAIRCSLSKRFVCIVYFAIQGYKLFLNKINHVSLWIDISWREFISKSRGKPFLVVRIIKYIISTLQIWRGAWGYCCDIVGLLWSHLCFLVTRCCRSPKDSECKVESPFD